MKTLTSKERVLAAIAHEEPDRVPINHKDNPGIRKRLFEHFGVSDVEGLLQALHVDFRRVMPAYSGPKLFEDLPGVKVDNWGVHRRWVEHEAGGYWDYCDFPLRDATPEQMETWQFPDPDDLDYEGALARARQMRDYCVVCGNGGTACVINKAGTLFSMDEALVRLHEREKGFLRFVDRRLNVEYQMLARTLEIAHPHIDMVMIGEDLGTQLGPMIGPELYREEIRPRHQRFVDLAKSYGKPVMIHCCGSSSWAFNDFIEMGIDVVDTLQPEAANMDPAYLKREYGDKLAFHGMISTTGALSFGSPDDVEENCRDILELMKPGGGYCFSPTHMIQDNTPTENVVRMYESALKYGRYVSCPLQHCRAGLSHDKH